VSDKTLYRAWGKYKKHREEINAIISEVIEEQPETNFWTHMLNIGFYGETDVADEENDY
jgi:hypothetical protein